MSADTASRPLRPGDRIPDFRGTSAEGTPVSREDLVGRPVVLYFYPRAGSPGCSIEAREFARNYPRLQSAGVRLVGVSVDPPDAQAKFRERCDVPFPLIADTEGEIGRRFGVLGRFGMARRVTFLVDADGRIVEIVRSWRPRLHVSRALARFAPSRD